MGVNKNIPKKGVSYDYSPATNPEDREKQMISLAEALAEKQLREGTASSQVITHYLKLGTMRAEIENEKLALEKELVKAKTDSIKAMQDQTELYAKALTALTTYRGGDDIYDE